MIRVGSRVRIVACHYGTSHPNIGKTGIASSRPNNPDNIHEGMYITLDEGKTRWFYLDEVEEEDQLTLTFNSEEYKPCQFCYTNTLTTNANRTCCECMSNKGICKICGGLIHRGRTLCGTCGARV